MPENVRGARADAKPDFKPLFTWRSAVCESNLKATTRHLLLTLSLHMNERGGSCFPSVETLASETGLGRATVFRQLQVAEDTGWLIIRRSQGRVSNRYEAALPPEFEPSRKTTVPERDGPTAGPSQKTTVSERESNRLTDEPQPSHSVLATVPERDPSSSVVLQGDHQGGRQPLAVAPQRRRDYAFEALCAVTGTAPTQLTETARGLLNKALREIKGAWEGDPEELPAEIRIRADRYVRQMPKARITATALSKHWPTLDEQSERLQSSRHRTRYANTVDTEDLAIIGKYAR
jgi:DNA-binding transcriptional regulator YhcF (GntR family)